MAALARIACPDADALVAVSYPMRFGWLASHPRRGRVGRDEPDDIG
jgi:hypothetical protein